MASTATFPKARSAQGIDGALWEGNIRGRLKDQSGVFGSWFGPINGTTFTFNPGAGETIQRVSKMIGSSGQVLNAIVQAGQPSVAFGFDDMGLEQFKLATRGESSALSEAGGSVSAQDLVLPAGAKGSNGGWIELAHRNIDSAQAFTITGDGGTPTHTFSADADDDYGPIDYLEGLVFLPPASAINGGDTIELTYTHLAVTADLVKGNKVDQTILELIFQGKNKANQQWIRFHAFQANVSPTTDIDLLGSALAVGAYSGSLETPADKEEPYQVQWDIQYAAP